MIPARRPRRWSLTFGLSAALSLAAGLALLALLTVFILQSLPVWRHTGWDFLSGKTWFYRQETFGIAPMIYGSLAVAAVALGLAVPLGLGAAVFTAEFLPARWRLGMKMGIELLAGIPSVVYGLLGILVLRGWVYGGFPSFDPLSGDTLLTGGLLLAVMILPTLISLGDDALRAVPGSQRLAARALGLNASEAAWHVALPQALPGLAAAVMLAAGRACGEMIAVFLVIGRQDNQWPQTLLSFPPLLSAGQTLATKLGSSETNIAYGDPLHWAAMMALGLVLLAIVTALTLLGVVLQSRHRRPHEA